MSAARLGFRLVLMAAAVSIASLLGFLLPTYAAGPPSLVCEDSRVDLGLINSSAGLVRRPITIANRGKAVLRLDLVGSSCGCTSVERMSREIPPGSSGTVVLQIDPSKSGSGSQAQRLVFSTNDPSQPQFFINVRWTTRLLHAVRLSPLRVDVTLTADEVDRGIGNAVGTLTIVDAWKDELQLVQISSSPNVGTTANEIRYLCPTCPTGGVSHAFTIDYRLLPSLPSGNIDEWVEVQTNHPERTHLRVPITGYLNGAITAEPAVLIFGPAQPFTHRRVVLRPLRPQTPLVIADVRSQVPWARAVIDERDPLHAALRVEIIAAVADDDPRMLLDGQIIITLKQPAEMQLGVRLVLDNSNSKAFRGISAQERR
jgi:hypothetical protein